MSACCCSSWQLQSSLSGLGSSLAELTQLAFQLIISIALTVGVPGTIARLAAEDLQATLAVSLHASS